MTDLAYCKECFITLKEKSVCAKCQASLRKIWAEETLFPRYRTTTFNDCDNKFVKPLKEYADYYLNQDSLKTGMFIYGSIGIGKTQLVHAMCNYIFSNARILYRNTPSPIQLYLDQELAFKLQRANSNRDNESVNSIIDKIVNFSRRGLVIIDDVGQGIPRMDVVQSTYNLLIDKIYLNNGWLILVSNHDLVGTKDYIGYYAVDRIIQMCGEDRIITMKGESLRK